MIQPDFEKKIIDEFYENGFVLCYDATRPSKPTVFVLDENPPSPYNAITAFLESGRGVSELPDVSDVTVVVQNHLRQKDKPDLKEQIISAFDEKGFVLCLDKEVPDELSAVFLYGTPPKIEIVCDSVLFVETCSGRTTPVTDAVFDAITDFEKSKKDVSELPDASAVKTILEEFLQQKNRPDLNEQIILQTALQEKKIDTLKTNTSHPWGRHPKPGNFLEICAMSAKKGPFQAIGSFFSNLLGTTKPTDKVVIGNKPVSKPNLVATFWDKVDLETKTLYITTQTLSDLLSNPKRDVEEENAFSELSSARRPTYDAPLLAQTAKDNYGVKTVVIGDLKL